MDDFLGTKISCVRGLVTEVTELLVAKAVTFWSALDVTEIRTALYGNVIG